LQTSICEFREYFTVRLLNIFMGVRYTFQNIELDLTNSSRAILYDNGKLIFKGDGYIAIKMFITRSGNNKSVIKKFKAQLDQREQPRWKDDAKDKKFENEIKKEEQPKK